MLCAYCLCFKYLICFLTLSNKIWNIELIHQLHYILVSTRLYLWSLTIYCLPFRCLHFLLFLVYFIEPQSIIKSYRVIGNIPFSLNRVGRWKPFSKRETSTPSTLCLIMCWSAKNKQIKGFHLTLSIPNHDKLNRQRGSAVDILENIHICFNNQRQFTNTIERTVAFRNVFNSE